MQRPLSPARGVQAEAQPSWGTVVSAPKDQHEVQEPPQVLFWEWEQYTELSLGPFAKDRIHPSEHRPG